LELLLVEDLLGVPIADHLDGGDAAGRPRDVDEQGEGEDEGVGEDGDPDRNVGRTLALAGDRLVAEVLVSARREAGRGDRLGRRGRQRWRRDLGRRNGPLVVHKAKGWSVISGAGDRPWGA
jgi:hypothetical protein